MKTVAKNEANSISTLQSKPRVWLSCIKKKVIFSQIIYALITHWSSSIKMNRKKLNDSHDAKRGKHTPLGSMASSNEPAHADEHAGFIYSGRKLGLKNRKVIILP